MKTVKIDNEYYGKIKELADASGQTVVGTVGSVLSAGLGELDELGEAITNSQELRGSNRPKIGRSTGAEDVDFVATEEPNPGAEEEEGRGTNWLLLGAAALIGILALRHRLQQANNAQQNGLMRNG